jgi:Flp pilus assembly pilin Flp
MTDEPFDAPKEKTGGGPGWAWGLGGAIVAGVIAIVVVIPLVAIIIIAGLTLLGTSLNDKFETVGSQVQPAGGGSSLHLFVTPESLGE